MSPHDPKTLCVGWPADPPCPVYGDMHGCDLADGHWGRHLCACRNQAYAPPTRPHRPDQAKSG